MKTRWRVVEFDAVVVGHKKESLVEQRMIMNGDTGSPATVASDKSNNGEVLCPIDMTLLTDNTHTS